MQASLSNLEIIDLTKYNENQEIITKGVPQTAQISKLEWIFSKFPSQLEIGGEQLFGGTAREVLFRKRQFHENKSSNKEIYVILNVKYL